MRKLTVPQLANKFPAFYANRRLIILCAGETATCPILSKVNLVHDQSFLLKIHFHFNIIFPSIARHSNCSLCFRFPQQNPVGALPPYHTGYMPRRSHFRDLITRIIFDEAYKAPQLCSFLYSPVTSFVLGPKIFLSTLFPNTLSLCVTDQVSHPYKLGKIIIRSLIFWGVTQRNL